MTDLPKPTASLREIQEYVAKVIAAREVNQKCDSEFAFIKLAEEFGEVARALRQLHGAKVAPDTSRAELSGELADVLIILLDIANCENVDLFDALVAKEKINRQRVWKSVNKEEN